MHVVRQFSPAVGGLENFVLCLAREQRRAGYDARVLTLNKVFHRAGPSLPDRDEVEGVPVRRLPWTGSYKYPLALSALLHVKDYDLIHVHAVDFFADYLSVTRVLHKTPMVLSTHGGFFHSAFASKLKRAYFSLVTRQSLRGYARVIACSEGDKRLFEKLCSPKLLMIENGVDIEKFNGEGSTALENAFLFIGRFSTNKRIDRLLETMHRLRQILPNVRLTIAGRDWDGNLQRMRRQITALGLDENVTIQVDPDDDQILAEVRRHSFIVSASEYEGFGMTLVEGMAAGLVPIASPIESFSRIINDAGVGLLIDFSDASSAAADIAKYYNNLEPDFGKTRQACVAAARRYGWANTARRFNEIYDAVCGVRARDIQGVVIDNRTGDEIIKEIDDSVRERRLLRIAIANANTVNIARRESDFRNALRSFLVLNDGTGVGIASKWKYGKTFAENLNGTDFVPRLLTGSSQTLRVFLLGGRPEVVKRAARNFAARYPQHHWVGHEDGYFDAGDEALLCERVREAKPDLLLVAMGNPLQEKWIARCAERTGAAVCIGVGALFDFVAGEVDRAPVWVRRIGCEWVFRLVQEPGRLWRRYLLGNIAFLWAARGDRL